MSPRCCWVCFVVYVLALWGREGSGFGAVWLPCVMMEMLVDCDVDGIKAPKLSPTAAAHLPCTCGI
jgi:hypothetical protein